MPRIKIHYAVIALTKTNVEDVIHILEEQTGNDNVIKWLKENKSNVYGDLLEDWRPFRSEKTQGDKIQEIIECDRQDYHSETHLVAKYFENPSEAPDLSHIDVFFIDIFSMYLPTYKELAKRTDFAFCSAQNNKCCFLLDYTLPHIVQMEMEKLYNISWQFVSSRYRNGCLHRMAARIDDLTNFRNYLITLAENQDLPNSKTGSKIVNTMLKGRQDLPLKNFSILR
jgi:hypothetical protein